jgi:hypothetical protein
MRGRVKRPNQRKRGSRASFQIRSAFSVGLAALVGPLVAPPVGVGGLHAVDEPLRADQRVRRRRVDRARVQLARVELRRRRVVAHARGPVLGVVAYRAARHGLGRLDELGRHHAPERVLGGRHGGGREQREQGDQDGGEAGHLHT